VVKREGAAEHRREEGTVFVPHGELNGKILARSDIREDGHPAVVTGT